MPLTQIDTLELELRKLDGVRTVGFTSSPEALYIQLFINENTGENQLPFEATRIARRHSNQAVAVEIVRTKFKNNPLIDIHNNHFENSTTPKSARTINSYTAGNISTTDPSKTATTQVDPSSEISDHEKKKTATHADFFKPTGETEDDDYLEVPSNSFNEDAEEEIEINLIEQDHLSESVENDVDIEYKSINENPLSNRIELLLVSTSPDNDEIEVHLNLADTRTIGRSPSSRGLLGAIDSTVDAIGELVGVNDFHGEWARSLEPGSEHASLVAVGLINEDGTETRHGIAGGSSPIEAAARATLNALNRIASLANA